MILRVLIILFFELLDIVVIFFDLWVYIYVKNFRYNFCRRLNLLVFLNGSKLWIVIIDLYLVFKRIGLILFGE